MDVCRKMLFKKEQEVYVDFMLKACKITKISFPNPKEDS